MTRFWARYLDRAFELAFFLHPERELALAVTTDALSLLEVVATDQDKRRYYRPRGRRPATGVGRRQRVSMSKPQLFQRLLYHASEPYERDQENRAVDLDEDDWTVRYLSFLVRACLGRNAFHTTVGISRLLFAYPTRETVALFDLVAQDREHLPSEEYVRASKKLLLDELRQRFGGRLRTIRAQHGELRFAARPPTTQLRHLVDRGLALMTPWQTRCVVPETFDPTEQTIDELVFRGPDPDGEHPIEMHRIHALLHPPCLRRLTRALRLDPPEDCLEVPELTHDAPPRPPDHQRCDRLRPSRLDEAGRKAIAAELDRRDELRRKIRAGVFRVRVDGREAAVWNTEHTRVLTLDLVDDAELVEVLGRHQGDDVPMVVFYLPQLAKPLAEPQSVARVALRRRHGHGFELRASRSIGASGKPGGRVQLQVTWRPSLAWRVTSWLGTGRPPFRKHAGGQLAAAAVLLASVAFGAHWLLDVLQQRSPVPVEVRGPNARPTTLAEVERVFVDSLGTGAVERQLGEHLSQRLEVAAVFTVPERRSQAQAVLMRGRSRPADAHRIALRLVDPRGEVLWQGDYRLPAEEGETVALATRVVAELEAAVVSAAGRR